MYSRQRPRFGEVGAIPVVFGDPVTCSHLFVPVVRDGGAAEADQGHALFRAEAVVMGDGELDRPAPRRDRAHPDAGERRVDAGHRHHDQVHQQRLADQRIVAGVAIERVVAVVAKDPVAIGCTGKRVVPGASLQGFYDPVRERGKAHAAKRRFRPERHR